MYTIDTDVKEIREAAKAAGIKWVGVKKEVLVEQLNALQAPQQPQTESVEVQDAQVESVEVPAVTADGVRISKHVNHANCQELLALLAVIDINTATVKRGSKNPIEAPLVTEKEKELLAAFQQTGYNIKKTGEVLGFSHTNVWQRLYGTPDKPEKPAKGILGKLRQYHEATQQEVNEAV